MKKSLMLIINPVAGKAAYKTNLAGILEIFSKGGFLVTVFFTECSGDATSLVIEYSTEFDQIVCMGGDGTLSEVISGLMQVAIRSNLGYIPLGTTNDVASTLNLPQNTAQAALTILEGKPAPFDVGKFGSRGFFTYIAAFGAFTEVSYATPQATKQTFGHLAYILEGMKRVTKITSCRARLTYDEGSLEGDFIFGAVTNSTSIAGLVKLDSGDVGLSDGLFEIILIKNPKKLADVNKLVGDILSKNYQSNNIILLRSRQIHFEFDEPVAWTRDGESGGSFTELTLENRNAAVNIIVSK